jgi:hypothetical protein
MNVEKVEGKENLKATIPSTDFYTPKTTSECQYFNYLDSMIKKLCKMYM